MEKVKTSEDFAVVINLTFHMSYKKNYLDQGTPMCNKYLPGWPQPFTLDNLLFEFSKAGFHCTEFTFQLQPENNFHEFPR